MVYVVKKIIELGRLSDVRRCTLRRFSYVLRRTQTFSDILGCISNILSFQQDPLFYPSNKPVKAQIQFCFMKVKGPRIQPPHRTFSSSLGVYLDINLFHLWLLLGGWFSLHCRLLSYYSQCHGLFQNFSKESTSPQHNLMTQTT